MLVKQSVYDAVVRERDELKAVITQLTTLFGDKAKSEGFQLVEEVTSLVNAGASAETLSQIEEIFAEVSSDEGFDLVSAIKTMAAAPDTTALEAQIKELETQVASLQETPPNPMDTKKTVSKDSGKQNAMEIAQDLLTSIGK